jgi:hypothetical protein
MILERLIGRMHYGLILMLAGCGGPRLHPVQGTVMQANAPVIDAIVMFHPVEGGSVAHGITGPTGKFMLIHANQPGVPPGQYQVTIARREPDLPPDGPGSEPMPLPAPPQPIAERYGNVATSGLSARVPSPESYHFVLDAK